MALCLLEVESKPAPFAKTAKSAAPEEKSAGLKTRRYKDSGLVVGGAGDQDGGELDGGMGEGVEDGLVAVEVGGIFDGAVVVDLAPVVVE
jgi:hypothetical protein